MRIKITNDLYDIATRIKEIDEEYEIFFDTDLQKFTLWGKGIQQLVFPFEGLDCRALRYAEETRVRYLDEIIAKMDKEKEEYDRKRLKTAQDKVEDEFSRRLRLSKI